MFVLLFSMNKTLDADVLKLFGSTAAPLYLSGKENTQNDVVVFPKFIRSFRE